MKKYGCHIIAIICMFILFCVLNIRSGWKSYEFASGHYSDETYLHGGISTLELDKRITYRVRYEVDLKSGKLIGELYDSTYDMETFRKPDEKQIVAKMEMGKSGTYYMDLPITDSGTYYLSKYAVEGTKASVDTYIEVRQYMWQVLFMRIWNRMPNSGEVYKPF